MNKGIVALSFGVIFSVAPTSPTQGTILFSSDLESEDSTAWSNGAAAGNTVNGWQLSESGGQVIRLSQAKAHSGKKSIMLTFTKNEDLGCAYRTITPINHVFVRYYTYFTNANGGNFDHAAAQKIGRISSWNPTSETVNYDMITYATAGMGNNCGIMPMTGLDIAYNGGSCGADWTDVSAGGGLQSNRWYCVEWEVQLNTVGQSNGVTRVWVDGVKTGEQTGLKMISQACQLNWILFGGWYSNGVSGNPCPNPDIASIRYIDDCVISDAYIGPIATTPQFIPADSVIIKAQIGKPFSYSIPYVNPLGGTPTFSYVNKPTWITTVQDSLYGTPMSQGTYQFSEVLAIAGKSYDTLGLKIITSTTGVITEGGNTPISFNILSLPSRASGADFNIFLNMAGSFRVMARDVAGKVLWVYDGFASAPGMSYLRHDYSGTKAPGIYFVSLLQEEKQTTTKVTSVK